MKLFVGFDMQNKNIKILNSEKAVDGAAIEYLHFQSRIFTDEFFAEAQELLRDYFTKKPSLLNLPAYVVLPDQAVGFETFNLPNMPRVKQLQTLETEFANLYEGRHKDKKINRFIVSQNKQYTTYGAVLFDKKLISRIYNLLTDVKLFPKETTYSGNALLNSVYNFMPKSRGKNFVFADVHFDYTEIAVSSKGKTLGVAIIPHGVSLLKGDKVEMEYMRTDHETGEIAVINARETARAKSLTLSGEEIDLSVIPEGATVEDYAVDASAGEEYSGNAAKEEAAGTQAEGEAVLEAAATAEESVTEQIPEDADFIDEEEEAARLAQEAKAKLAKTKIYRKMPKRYPKFMQRELPETENGIMYENFRIIMKWILLYARQAQLSEYTVSPEYILINIPESFYHLLDRANEEQGEEGLNFRPFVATDKFAAEIKGNLNLYGCLFAKNYNKNHNF